VEEIEFKSCQLALLKLKIDDLLSDEILLILILMLVRIGK